MFIIADMSGENSGKEEKIIVGLVTGIRLLLERIKEGNTLSNLETKTHRRNI